MKSLFFSDYDCSISVRVPVWSHSMYYEEIEWDVWLRYRSVLFSSISCLLSCLCIFQYPASQRVPYYLPLFLTFPLEKE